MNPKPKQKLFQVLNLQSGIELTLTLTEISQKYGLSQEAQEILEDPGFIIMESTDFKIEPYLEMDN